MILRVAKREGNTVTGVRIVSKAADGRETTTTAETGSLQIGSVELPTDTNVVRITLHGAKIETAGTHWAAQQLMLVLR